MRKVELVPGMKSSILGFGCAPVLGAVGARSAAAAIGKALDSGVTHFDLARSYGYGDAERFVGRFLKGQRDRVIIASKFGIQATWKAELLRPLKPLVRAFKKRRNGPTTRKRVDAPSGLKMLQSDPFHSRVPLTASSMRKSLESSLMAIGSDYLDILFIHEPTGALQHANELTEAATKLRTEGKIRAWGLAFSWTNHKIFESEFPRFDILQFDNSPNCGHYDAVRRSFREKPNIFFSPLRIPGDLNAAETLRTLWRDFPKSVVLCSMFDPDHISANASVAREMAGLLD